MSGSDSLTGHLDALARRAMAHWHIPGLALGVVLPGQEALLRTYGVRDTEGGKPVTPRTQFHVGSLTKSFTAAGLLLQLAERGLPLTTRVRDLLPEFRLSDAFVTEQVTVRDFLCHASGLPRHDRVWTPCDLPRAELLQRLRHLPLACGLRERFHYSNLGYVVLAAISQRLSGARWQDHLADTLLKPLGCSDFSFSPQALLAARDHAHPHPRDPDQDGICRGRVWPAVAPAGGLNASLADMVRWLQFLLGAPLPHVPAERTARVLEAMMTPWIYSGRSAHPEIGHLHYGLGLSCEHYRGERVVTHGGTMPGWRSLLALLPDRGCGVVVLTNREISPVPQILVHAVFDAVAGLEPIDWYERFAQARVRALAEEAAERAQRAAEAARPVAPTRPLADYAGRFHDPAYGSFDIALQDGRLAWSWRGFSGVLRPRGHDMFELEETPPARHGGPFAGTFLYDRRGQVDRLALALEPTVADIVFHRQQPGAPSADSRPL